MEVQLRGMGGRVICKVEGGTVKETFKNLALMSDAFDADTNCGMCSSPHIRFNFRVAQEYEFYELKCNECGARLSFGQIKGDGGGRLWAKRKDDDGNALEHRGWSKYEPDATQQQGNGKHNQQQRSTAPAQRQAAPPSNGTQRQAPYNRQPTSQPDPPDLVEMLRNDPNDTMMMLCENLRAIFDEESLDVKAPCPKTDAAWNKASERNASDVQIIRNLYWRIKHEVPTGASAA